MNNEIINQLYKFSEKMKNFHIEPTKTEKIFGRHEKNFIQDFGSALSKFKLANPLDKTDFNNACNVLHYYMIQIESNDLLVANQYDKELDEYRQKCIDLESNIEQKQLLIEKQQIIIAEYRTKLELIVKLHPALKDVIMSHDGDVSNIE